MKSVVVLMIGIIFFLTGCMQPKFNPNIGSIIFVEGKPYRIPNGTIHKNKTYKNTKSDRKKIYIYKKYGLICKTNDVFWATKDTLDRAMNILNTQGKEASYKYIAYSGKAGCASPLSRQEYNYYIKMDQLSEQRRREDNIRRDNMYRDYQKELAENRRRNPYQLPVQPLQSPRNINVYHSGSINVNTYGY